MTLYRLKRQFIIVNLRAQQELVKVCYIHAKVAAETPAIAFGKSKEGVDYQSLDMQPAHLFL